MRALIRFLAVAAVLALAVLAVVFWRHVRNEFFVLLGSRNEAGGWYGFNSGAGGAFYMSLIPAGILLYWHHSCNVSFCFLPGRHQVDGSRWCNVHHLSARKRLADTGSAHDLTGP